VAEATHLLTLVKLRSAAPKKDEVTAATNSDAVVMVTTTMFVN